MPSSPQPRRSARRGSGADIDDRRDLTAAPLARTVWISTVVLLGMAAIVRATTVGGPTGPAALVAALVAMLVAGELAPLAVGPRDEQTFTASWAFGAALVLVAPPVVALLAIAAASAIGDAVARKSPAHVAFNAGALPLSLGVGVGVLEATGQRAALLGDGQVSVWFVPAVLLAGAVVLATNAVAVAVVVRADGGPPVTRFLRSGVPRALLDDGILFALGPVLAAAGLRSLALLPLPVLGVAAMRQRMRDAADSREQARADSLTGLVNRQAFLDALALASPGGGAVAVVDLDGFKAINDELGHATGDRVLEIAAQRLRAAVRPVDLVARMGGDEFAILFRDLGPDETELAGSRLVDAFADPIQVEGVPMSIRASVGVACGTDVAVLERADEAMYRSKARARQELVHGDEAGGTRLGLLRALGRSIHSDDLVVHYQPQIRLDTGRTVGFEALVRWRQPGRGAVSPREFIAAAEQTELLRPLTERVLVESLATCRRWRELGHPVGVSVNVSTRSLVDCAFPDLVLGTLARLGVAPQVLRLEVTESAALVDLEGIARTLGRLVDHGVHVAMDDFGSGTSSLEHLIRLPIDQVKIDRSLVADLDGGDGARFVGPIIALAHSLGAEVVAAGVESESVVAELRRLGCDMAQGFHYCRPVPTAETFAWLGREARDPALAPTASGPVPARRPA